MTSIVRRLQGKLLSNTKTSKRVSQGYIVVQSTKEFRLPCSLTKFIQQMPTELKKPQQIADSGDQTCLIVYTCIGISKV